jgi:DNA polymerase
MRFVVIDFETFYTSEYSLSKMSTEEYVTDPRFEIILVGIKIDHAKPYWITGTKAQIAAHLAALKLYECAVLCHNTMFDGLILVVHFDIIAAVYCDSMLLAQAIIKPFNRSISLDSCLKHINLGILKGTAVHNMIGRPRQSLSKQELESYGAYCMDDCEGEFRLFRYLAPQFPKSELELIDLTLRMYLQPQFELDPNLLAEHLAEVHAKKEQAINSLPADVVKADLMSNPKFADALTRYGVEPPTKISPTTGMIAYAFAKTDTAWKELEEEWADDPIVSALITARISAKSTIEETRTTRLLDIAIKQKKFRVPIRYYAAHTGRDGGTEGINAQNFPRASKSRMRFAVVAPKNHVVIAADLAQIEARIVAWLANEIALVEGFRRKEDVYADFAVTAYGVSTVKGRSADDDKRRFVGKSCILGLGFGMAAVRLRARLRQEGILMELPECERLVNVYRNVKYRRIPLLWRQLDGYLGLMSSGTGQAKFGPCTLTKHSIILPNGMALVYDRLRQHATDKYSGWVYNFAGEIRTLWGGKVTENIVQALARILVMDHALTIRNAIGLKPALRQHDELDYVVHERHAEKVIAVIGKIMRVPPAWAPDLPVEVEINYGPTLGDCK